LTDVQNTIAQQLAQAQLANQQLSANLSEQRAGRQANIANSQQQLGLGYNQLAASLTSQPHMAIQPYLSGPNQMSQYNPSSFMYRPQSGQALRSNFGDFSQRPMNQTEFGGYENDQNLGTSYADLIESLNNSDLSYGDYPYKSPEMQNLLANPSNA
jgi:hypothetical protein